MRKPTENGLNWREFFYLREPYTLLFSACVAAAIVVVAVVKDAAFSFLVCLLVVGVGAKERKVDQTGKRDKGMRPIMNI